MTEIRKPQLNEMTEVKKLLDHAADAREVLPRPIMELYETARDFHVSAGERGIEGCCALHIDTEALAEIRSLVVRTDLRCKGIGSQLLDACIEEAKQLAIERVYALTRAVAFFAKHGFHEVDKHTLPHKVFQDCLRCPLFPDCDEVAVVRDLDGS